LMSRMVVVLLLLLLLLLPTGRQHKQVEHQ
jgi:hypothetical protein